MSSRIFAAIVNNRAVNNVIRGGGLVMALTFASLLLQGQTLANTQVTAGEWSNSLVHIGMAKAVVGQRLETQHVEYQSLGGVSFILIEPGSYRILQQNLYPQNSIGFVLRRNALGALRLSKDRLIEFRVFPVIATDKLITNNTQFGVGNLKIYEGAVAAKTINASYLQQRQLTSSLLPVNLQIRAVQNPEVEEHSLIALVTQRQKLPLMNGVIL